MGKTINGLARDFLSDENLSLTNSLAYAGLGMSKVTGQANEIISGVGFAGYQYSPDRQKRMMEILGEMMFYWHVLATTVAEVGSVEQIIEQYINEFEAVKVKIAHGKITIQDMMDMGKYVKAGALRDIELKRDAEEKAKAREQIL